MILVPSAKMSLTPTDECVLRRSTMRTAASLKADPYHGLDSRWSWITAAFCSWVMFMGTLSIRVSGVLFYGIVETFQVTREEASWPVTLNGSLLNLAGRSSYFYRVDSFQNFQSSLRPAPEQISQRPFRRRTTHSGACYLFVERGDAREMSSPARNTSWGFRQIFCH